jgi:hypothetical protein
MITKTATRIPSIELILANSGVGKKGRDQLIFSKIVAPSAPHYDAGNPANGVSYCGLFNNFYFFTIIKYDGSTSKHS